MIGSDSGLFLFPQCSHEDGRPEESIEKILLVGARGFEPPTPCAQGRCATRLRYAPTGENVDYPTCPPFGWRSMLRRLFMMREPVGGDRAGIKRTFTPHARSERSKDEYPYHCREQTTG